jgi:hypothetical protein
MRFERELDLTPAHSDFLIGHDDKAPGPSTDGFVAKDLFYTFYKLETAGRAESNQHNPMMGAEREPPSIREIQILRDQQPLFSLRCAPKIGIVAAREPLIRHGVNVVSKATQAECNLQR